MTRNDIAECLPSTPVLPIVVLCNTENDIDEVEQVIAEVHGSRYINQYDVRVVLNTQENRDMIRSILCLAYLDTSCLVF